MAVSSAVINVGTTATSLVAEAGSIAGAQVRLKNKGASPVFLGASGVTTANGLELATGEVATIDLAPGEELFGIVTTGTMAVHVLITKN